MDDSIVRMVVLPLVVAVVVLLGVPALFQDSQIYFPDRAPLADVLADARRHGLAPWPAEDDYRGLLREPVGLAHGTVVLFHGNAGHAGHRDWYADELARLGLRVILAEYPAYGPRAGKLGEASLVTDATETLSLAAKQFPGSIVLAGESLGAAVAAAVAERAEVAALLLITPWDDIARVASHHYPWLPARWLLRDRYDSVTNLVGFRAPVAVVIAERDSIVPPARGRALYESLAGPKRLWVVPRADHNDWPMYVDAQWWPSVVDFVLSAPR